MPHETNRFLVLTSARSGSTWLIDMLRSIDNTRVYGEMFLRRERQQYADYPRFVERRPDRGEIRPWSVFSYLNRLYGQPGTVGFKLMYAQLLFFPEIWIYLWRHRIRIVHLVRSNHLDVVISREFLKIRDRPHFVVGQEPEPMEIHLDPALVLREMKRLRRNISLARTFLRGFNLPHIEVSYEELTRSPTSFNSIWDFLLINVERRIPTSKLQKIRKRTQADVIRNYDEIKRALEGTEFANLLECADC